MNYLTNINIIILIYCLIHYISYQNDDMHSHKIVTIMALINSTNPLVEKISAVGVFDEVLFKVKKIIYHSHIFVHKGGCLIFLIRIVFKSIS